jgi:hypothetical protein
MSEAAEGSSTRSQSWRLGEILALVLCCLLFIGAIVAASAGIATASLLLVSLANPLALASGNFMFFYLHLREEQHQTDHTTSGCA